jgi:hypothetical protein
VIGGILNDTVLKHTFELSDNLSYKQVALMNLPRHSCPIALFKDKFILAAGGNTEISKKKYTNSTEIYDIS